MKFQSGFMNNLKLLLTGKYNVLDKDLKSLSSIILKYNLGDVTENGNLVGLIYVMDKNHLKFPVSLNFLHKIWESTLNVFDFNKTMRNLVNAELIVLRRMKEETFFNSTNIEKDLEKDVVGNPYYITVSGTSLYNDFMKEITLLGLQNMRSEIQNMTVSESVIREQLDKKYQNFVDRVKSNILKDFYESSKMESYEYDSFKNTININFLLGIRGLKSPKIKPSDIQRIIKKYVKGESVENVESYADDNKTMFFSVGLDMRVLTSELNYIADILVEGIHEILNLLEEE